jgi:superfamily II DNA/RNA helicase
MANDRRTPHQPQSNTDTLETSFAALGVPTKLCDVLHKQGITEAFPVQAMTLPDSLSGRDVLGRGRTGSGKTLAFALPLVTRLAAGSPSAAGRPRGLVLAPTRELARQINETMLPLARAFGLTTTTVYGGVPAGPQITALRRGTDIVIACPGRLEDHLRGRHLTLDAVEITVLDEADHMADLGFLPAVQRILQLTPRGGQRLLFSATLDGAVGSLVQRYLREPVSHGAEEDADNGELVDHHIFEVRSHERLPVLVELTSAPGRTVVFTRTKHGASKLAHQLVQAGVPAVEMHGNLNQSRRSRNLAAFTDGRAMTMVATDIAARGIHVDDVRMVIHADPPLEHKSYLHRSGRTARAGATGTVVTLATKDQHGDVRRLSKRAGISPVFTTVGPGHALLLELAPGERNFRDASEIEKSLEERPQQQQRSGSPRQSHSRPRARSNGRPGGAPKRSNFATERAEGDANRSRPRPRVR